ncbi:MAG: M6 family metalloprotease domain-containing protein [Prevotella sp.]|nr:M6 family metalloprotease domain-containing protein [Prevotella sp.]
MIKSIVGFRKTTFIFALLCMWTIEMWGVKADPTPTLITQSDGTQLVVIGRGDCNFHWYTTVDGVLLFHQGDDYFVASVDDNGLLQPTKHLAHEVSQRNEIEKSLIARQAKAKFFDSIDKRLSKSEIGNSSHKEPVKENHTYFPHTGSPKVLILLVQFQDVKFIDEDPVPVFEEYFNAEGALNKNVGNGTVSKNYGSVKRYFKEMSNGTFTPQFDIYGPVTLSNPLAYYGEDASANNHDQIGRLMKESFYLADSIGVDFSQYDQNNDDMIDLFYVVYAGYGQCFSGNSSDCIWPKSGTVTTGYQFDGKFVYRYGVNNELDGAKGGSRETKYGMPFINGIGLFCHEFTHCMGLPDFYPTSASAQNVGNPAMEYWDLMDGGEFTQNGNYPTEYTAWERESLGWMEMDTLTVDGEYEIMPLGVEGGKAYRLMNENDPTGQEYLFLQNIQDHNFNRAVARVLGHGLLATHVDYDASAFALESNSVNNTVGHSRMTVLAADGQCLSSYLINDTDITSQDYIAEHGGDPYPGTSNVTQITNIPFYKGTSEQAITNIQENAETGAIKFNYTKSTTGIREISLPEATTNETIVRDLSGRIVGDISKGFSRRGIYIVGNKKLLMK